MKTLENKGGVDRRALAEAAEALARGEIIIYPTDTLYAFGCDALNARAIERLCRLKGLSPDKNCLSVVCSGVSQAAEYARIDNKAFRLAKEYLPGPYTLILPASTTLPKVFKGRKSVGIRIPDCEFARALAEELGHPVLTSSVPDDPEGDFGSDGLALAYRFGNTQEITVAVDAGQCPGVPSTVVDCTDSSEPLVLRQGAGYFEG